MMNAHVLLSYTTCWLNWLTLENERMKNIVLLHEQWECIG
jgi:hypothetical protein